MAIEIVDDFRPIIENIKHYKYRYFAYLTGRMGLGKSTNIATCLLVCGLMKPLRILCARETMSSIKDSVHAQLSDIIKEHNLPYHIYNDSIKADNGTVFIFKGLRETGSHNVRSMTNVNICWCFPAGTKVDGKNIEDFNVGDYVKSYNFLTKKIEYRRIVRFMKKKAPKSLIRLTFDGSHSIVGTKNHPIYVKDKGWIPFKDIKKGDIVYAEEIRPTRVCSLFRWLWGDDSDRHSMEKTSLYQERRNLLQRLRSKDMFRKDEKEQSHGQSRNFREDEKDHYQDGHKAKNTWWQWSWLFQSTRVIMEKAWSWLVGGTHYTYGSLQGQRRIADQLQGRPCEYILRDSYRGRWWESLWCKIKSRRLAKNSFLREQRVESVKIQEQASLDRFGLSDGGDFVYNFEVQGNNNYFANGLLVHNCEESQSISAISWNSLDPTIRAKGSFFIISANPDQESDMVYQLFGPEAERRPDTYYCYKDYRSNPFPLPEAILKNIELMRINHPEDYEMIYLGKLRRKTDKPVVVSWSEDNVGVGKESSPIYWSLDFNVNPQCSVICHWNGGHDFYFSDEIVLTNASTYKVAECFVKLWKKRYAGRTVIINGDASGRARSSNSEYSNYAIIEQVLVKERIPFEFQVPKRNTSISNRVSNFDYHVKGLDGVRHILVDPRCRHLLQACRLLDYDDKGNIREPQARAGMKTIDYAKSHIFDAASYCVMINDPTLELFAKPEKPRLLSLKEQFFRDSARYTV